MRTKPHPASPIPAVARITIDRGGQHPAHSGVTLVKLWFSVSRDEQCRRFAER